VPGVVGVEQVAGQREELAPLFRGDLPNAEILPQPLAGAGAVEHGLAGHQADLAAAQVADEMHHRRQLRGREHPGGVHHRLAGHQQAAGARLGQFDRRGQVRVDALAVARDLRDLLPHALVHRDPGRPGAGVGDAEEEVGEAEVALDVREDAVPVQGRADERGRLGMPVEEDALPGNLHVVEHDHRVDLVVPARQRIVIRGALAGEGGPADVPDTRPARRTATTSRRPSRRPRG